MCSSSPSLLPPPSPSHPSGSSQGTSPEHFSHASNLGWWSVSPLVVYLFQCYSLRTSHPLLLPESKSLWLLFSYLFWWQTRLPLQRVPLNKYIAGTSSRHELTQRDYSTKSKKNCFTSLYLSHCFIICSTNFYSHSFSPESSHHCSQALSSL